MEDAHGRALQRELYPKNPPNTCKRGADHVFPFRLAPAIRLREPRSVFRYFRVATRFMTTQTAAAQQCFRSRPLLQEKGSVVSFFSCMARQKCTHGVSLHERAGVSPAVPPFLQRLLTVRSRLRIVLRHLQLIGIEFDHLAAGAFRECQDFCVWGGYSRGSPTRLPFVFEMQYARPDAIAGAKVEGPARSAGGSSLAPAIARREAAGALAREV